MSLIKLCRWIWEFPQCLLGLILTKLYDVKYSETYKGIDIYKGKFSGGISLGLYILMNTCSDKSTKDHEWGHTKQSLHWGWLYLPTVGLVSFTWYTLRRFISTWKEKDYYSIWPENKADEYGGVKRKKES
jgi:hypothetical protein